MRLFEILELLTVLERLDTSVLKKRPSTGLNRSRLRKAKRMACRTARGTASLTKSAYMTSLFV